MCLVRVSKNDDSGSEARHPNPVTVRKRPTSVRRSNSQIVAIRHPSNQAIELRTNGHSRTSIVRTSTTRVQETNGFSTSPRHSRPGLEWRSIYVQPIGPEYGDTILPAGGREDGAESPRKGPQIVEVAPTPTRSLAPSARQSQVRIFHRERDSRASQLSHHSNNSRHSRHSSGSRHGHSMTRHGSTGANAFVVEEDTERDLRIISTESTARRCRESSPGGREGPGRLSATSMHRHVSVSNGNRPGGSMSRSRSRERTSSMYVAELDRQRVADGMAANKSEIRAAEATERKMGLLSDGERARIMYGGNPRMSGSRLGERVLDYDSEGRRRESYITRAR